MIRRIGLIVNNRKSKAVEAGQFIRSEFSRRGIYVWAEGEDTLPELLDLIVILGGDGTVLQAFYRYRHLNVPFLCINFGTVGFLSSIEFDELSNYLPMIMNESYQIDERPNIQISVIRNNQETGNDFAINDLVIRTDHLHISRLLLKIDGRGICMYEGDGLIISTSTGSTGYALSAGSAIVDPSLPVVMITPLISRKKSLSPLITSMDHTLEIVCNDSEPRSKPFIDGRELKPLNHGEVIRISPSELKAKFVVLNSDRYFNLLRRRCI